MLAKEKEAKGFSSGGGWAALGRSLDVYYWIAVGLAGASLITSVTILYVMLKVWGSTHRVERAGEERLEILREQQQRLQFLREERRMLEEELEWRRSTMDGSSEERLLELNAPSERGGHSERDGHSESEQPKWRSWWRRIWSAVGS